MNIWSNETFPTMITNIYWTQIRCQALPQVLEYNIEQNGDQETVPTVVDYIWVDFLSRQAKPLQVCSSSYPDPASASSQTQNSKLGLPYRFFSPASYQFLKPLCGSLYVSGKIEQSSTWGLTEYTEAIVSLFLDTRVFPREAVWDLVQSFVHHGTLLPDIKLMVSCKPSAYLTLNALEL